MKKLLAILIIAFVSAASADQYSKWLDDDVKVLITKQEKDAFKKLKTDEQKNQFITEFWARRDPSPNSPTNEFKDFYDANLKYVRDTLKMPVDSDVGETYLLLGSPNDVKEVSKEERILIYQDSPKGVVTGEEQIKMVANEETGKFEFNDEKQANELFQKARDYYAQLGKAAAEQAGGQPAVPVPASLPAVTTPEIKAALDAAAAGNAPTAVPLAAIADSFMTSAGESFVTVAASSTADVSAARIDPFSKTQSR